MRMHSALLLVLFLPLAGCTDELVVPCRGADACAVPDMDLALAVHIEWTEDQPYHEDVGEHVVQPGDTLHLRYRVTNRGTLISPPSSVYLGAGRPLGSVPFLRPGESYEGTIEYFAPTWLGLYTDRFLVHAVLAQDSTGDLYFLSDADHANDEAYVAARLALPAIRVSVIVPDTMPRLEPAQVIVELTNISTVPTGSFTLGFCFDDEVCPREAPWFGRLHMPSLEPGETLTADLPVTMPAHVSTEGRLYACVALGPPGTPAVPGWNPNCSQQTPWIIVPENND